MRNRRSIIHGTGAEGVALSAFPLTQSNDEPVWVSWTGRTRLYYADCRDWLRSTPENSIHAVVTDPPYGMVEYRADQIKKLRGGRGGVWRIPPTLGGHRRQPLPRFTVLEDRDLAA